MCGIEKKKMIIILICLLFSVVSLWLHAYSTNIILCPAIRTGSNVVFNRCLGPTTGVDWSSRQEVTVQHGHGTVPTKFLPVLTGSITPHAFTWSELTESVVIIIHVPAPNFYEVSICNIAFVRVTSFLQFFLVLGWVGLG